MIDTDDSAEWVESVKENKAVIRLGNIVHNYTAPSTDHPDIYQCHFLISFTGQVRAKRKRFLAGIIVAWD